jgi:23S rRNA (uridine2552-2'-O)-methyltransferase
LSRRRAADHYSRMARQRAYPARSVFKLEEIDRRVRLLRRGMRVLDLGCAPGSWLKYASGRVGPDGLVVGVDLAEPSIALPPNARFVEGDVLAVEPPALGEAFDVVLSDMAPSTTGAALVDQERSFELFARAVHLASALLAPAGGFAGKLFFSPRHAEAAGLLSGCFREVRTLRPRATRSESREVFLVGLRFGG